MSQLQVTTLEANTLSANVITAGPTTVNSAGLYLSGSNGVVNTTAINVINESGNFSLVATINQTGIIVGNTNVFPNSNDIFAWASAASLYNMTHERDYSIERSPFGGIPYKIIPTAADPAPTTYGSNTWNLASTADGDSWKISGYIRTDKDVNLTAYDYLLVLPANTSGAYITAGITPPLPNLSLTANKWKYFETVCTLTGSYGNANTAYIQIRPDGEQSGTATTWYDGIKVEKLYKTLPNETVNTQIFSVAGSNTWTKPSWANTGNELVIVHLWGGGGSGSHDPGATASGGGGGAFVFGYFKSSQVNATCNVVVGAGGAAPADENPGNNGGNSIFYANTTNSLVAYGGAGGFANTTATGGGAGGGWLGVGTSTGVAATGGAPLGGTISATESTRTSTFGGGAGSNSSTGGIGGSSVYGGGGGGFNTSNAGSSIFGGGGGTFVAAAGSSVYGGRGANNTLSVAGIPGGGGTIVGAGARGEVRVYTLRITG
jgi:hypothetical protein